MRLYETATLTCSRCDWREPIEALRNLCPKCSAPILVHYDFVRASEALDEIRRGPADLRRFASVLSFDDPDTLLTLGEGVTPLLPSRTIGPELGARRLFIKDESKNPTRSFKARGMAVAVSMARKLGAESVAAPTAGNAGCALAAYAARAAMKAFVAMPEDTPQSIVREVESYGAELELVPGVITDAAKRVASWLSEHGGFELSTLKEPYRVEGKKTMAYELLLDLGELPDVILYPTGGGTGLVGMWKAFEEMERLGWSNGKRPRLYSVQSSGCAPVVRAFDQKLETAPEWEQPVTSAWGLRVPRAIGDRLMLTALRDSNGGAIAVAEHEIEAAAAELRRREGIDAGPESGAALLAYRSLLSRGAISTDESVVLFSTGGNKYF